MRDEEGRIWRRLKRRLKSARGTVYFEFAVVSPLALSLVLFAHDFTSILFAEQQLEVCSRALADVESHMHHYRAVKAVGYELERDGPCSVSKTMLKPYFAEVIGMPESKASSWVYCKGESLPVPGLSRLFMYAHDFLEGRQFDRKGFKGVLFNFLGKLLGDALMIVTLGTHVYVTELPTHDRMVRMTVSARVPTLLPRRMYDFLSCRTNDPDAWVLTVPYRTPIEDEDDVTTGWAWNKKPIPGVRRRAYCTMPSFDTVTVAPNTFVSKMRSWFGKWVPSGAWPEDTRWGK